MTNAFHLNTPFNLLLQLVICREIILITILQCTAAGVELIYDDKINVGSKYLQILIIIIRRHDCCLILFSQPV